MNIRNAAIRFHWLISSQFGLDPVKTVHALKNLPRYLRDLWRFQSSHRRPVTIAPCLHDWQDSAGPTRNEYFWQDLIVARRVFQAKPKRHVDIGSRVDGFIAHVASFRDIEVLDIRPLEADVPGMTFRKVDLSRDKPAGLPPSEYCDSLSCLHAIEHFGLGRYGDPLDRQGHVKGLLNMARMLEPEGRLYLSAPIGRERVEFNANRVFDPRSLIRIADTYGLQLRELQIIGSLGDVKQITLDDRTLLELAQCRYNLGLFFFQKLTSAD